MRRPDGLALTLLLLIAASLLTCGSGHNPCCSNPCHHGGVCMEQADKTYVCDCDNTGYSSKNCRRADWSTWFANLFRPSPEFAHNIASGHSIFWRIINTVSPLRKMLMRVVMKARTGVLDVPPLYAANKPYTSIEVVQNRSLYARTLPPIPEDCPTPMGVAGPKVLPSAEEVCEQLFKREKFKINSLRTNVLFATYAQHFTHMFFKTDSPRGAAYTWGDQNVYMSNVYGKDRATENTLRTFVGGKVRMQTINGEDYPPFDPKPKPYAKTPAGKKLFLVGHPVFNMLPNLLFLNTMFLREHNRVVSILAGENPHWDDERLFQTGKLILLGQTLKITIEDYVQHLSNYNFKLLYDPTIMFNEKMQYINHIHFEFKLLYHWHPLMPDHLRVNKTKLPIKTMLFNPWQLVEYGSQAFAKTLVETPAGEITHNNHGSETMIVAVNLMKQSRELRIQSFNQYRRRFRLAPYKSFIQLTGGNQELADKLKKLYHDVDAVEFYPGLICEQRRSKSMFGETLIEIGSPYSLQGLFGNSFASPHLWRRSTFGGDTGFRIVNEATIKKLICQNMPPPCPHISFKTEGENYGAVDDLDAAAKAEKEREEL